MDLSPSIPWQASGRSTWRPATRASAISPMLTAAAGKTVFARPVAADYDGDGKLENIQEEVQRLYERLMNKEGTGLLQTMKDSPYDKSGKFTNSKAKYPIDVVVALYNYKFVQEDRSRGIHNAPYAVQLFMDSIKALDRNFDD